MATDIPDKIMFIQPSFAKYRKKLFELLSDWTNIEYNYLDSTKDIYSSELPSNHEFKIFNGFVISKYIKLLLNMITKDWDVIVTSITASPQSILSTIVTSLNDTGLVVYTVEWRDNIWGNDFLSPLKRVVFNNIISGWVTKSADMVVVPGEPWVEYWTEKGASPSKIVSLDSHPTIDYRDVSPEPLNDEIKQIFERDQVVLYLGRIIELKGLDTLIKAMKEIENECSNTALVIVGDGSFRNECEQLAKEIGLESCVFTGKITNESNISWLYRNSDVFVLPSRIRGRYEGYGLTINEAMSVSKPVVTTTAVGAAGWAVKDGYNGYVVPDEDPVALSVGLKEILNNDNLRVQMGSNSREIFDDINDYDKQYNGFVKAITKAYRSNQ